MDRETRARVIAFHEGHVLQMMGNHGPGHTGTQVRAAVDGLMNGLVRIEGAEAVAGFAFALSDRIAGGIRDATAFVPRAQPDDPGLADAPAAPATAAETPPDTPPADCAGAVANPAPFASRLRRMLGRLT